MTSPSRPVIRARRLIALATVCSLALAATACASPGELFATGTPLPTDTPTATITHTPSRPLTDTPVPTNTPNATATEDARAKVTTGSILAVIDAELELANAARGDRRLVYYHPEKIMVDIIGATGSGSTSWRRATWRISPGTANSPGTPIRAYPAAGICSASAPWTTPIRRS